MHWPDTVGTGVGITATAHLTPVLTAGRSHEGEGGTLSSHPSNSSLIIL